MAFSLLKSFEPNTLGRDIVVGDIHGHYSRLMRSLRFINFNPDIDRLFSVGDLIDRGSENEKILYDLVKQPWFHPVMGNHEQMLIQIAAMPEYDLLNDIVLRKEIIGNGGAWYLGLTRAERIACADIVSDLPLAIELMDGTGSAITGMVHADVLGKSWAEFRGMLLDGNTDKDVKKYCLWAKSSQVVNHWLSEPIRDIKRVFVGHNILRANVESPWELPGLIRCDAGAWHTTTSNDCLFMLFDALSGECLIPSAIWPDWTIPSST